MAENHITLATVIVGYKNEELTTRYVREELSKLDVDHFVVIVNNASTKASCNYLKEHLDACVVSADFSDFQAGFGVYVIDVEDNLGFAKANNLGVDFIQRFFPATEYVLFTNNDIIIIDSHVVSALINKYASTERVGVIGPNVLYPDGKRQTPMPMTYLWKNILSTLISPFLHNTKRSVEYCDLAQEGFHYTFAECFFISRLKDYVACGMMDPHTFLYSEGNILSERMKRIGLGYYFVPEVTVIHDNGTTTQKHMGPSIYMTMAESNAYYYKKYRNYSSFSVGCYLSVAKVMCMLSKLKHALSR